MMVMSLMVTVNAATTSFPDAGKIDQTYAATVDVLSAAGVLKGDPESEGVNFRPTDPIKRSEFAKIIYMIKSGDTEAENASLSLYADACNFTDIAGSGEEWAAPFIGYAVHYGLVKGNGDGTFSPAANITVVDALTMLLRVLGYGQGGELEGKPYQVNALGFAEDAGLLENIPEGISKNTATRQVVAQLTYNVIQAPTVTSYSNTTGKYEAKGEPLAASMLKLAKEEASVGEFGCPSEVWTLDKKERITIPYQAVFKSAEVQEFIDAGLPAVDECDIVYYSNLNGANLSETKATPITTAYIDGVELDLSTEEGKAALVSDGRAEIHPRDEDSYVGNQGRAIEVYVVDGELWIVEINTYLGLVDSVMARDDDKHDHPSYGYANIIVYLSSDDEEGYRTVSGRVDMKENEPLAENDWVLVQVNLSDLDNDNISIEDYERIEAANTGKLTAFNSENITSYDATGVVNTTTVTSTVKATTYKYNNKFVFIETSEDNASEVDPAYNEEYYDKDEAKDNARNLSVLTDAYGNIIGLVKGASSYDLMTITKIEWKQYNGMTFGGYAIFEGVKYDYDETGETVTGRVAYISYWDEDLGETVTNEVTNRRDAMGDYTLATVSDYYENNGGAAYDEAQSVFGGWWGYHGYYGHIWSYYEIEDGVYTIILHEGDDVDETTDPIRHDEAQEDQKADVIADIAAYEADPTDTPTKDDEARSDSKNGVVKGGHWITDDGVNTYAINDFTKFVFYNPDDYTFKFVASRNDE